MNPAILTVYNILQAIFYVPLGLSVLYLFIFALAGIFYRQPAYPAAKIFRKIAVLIPAYKEDEVVTESVREALLQDYPRDSYDVIVIADSFRPETIQYLRALPVLVIEVQFDKSTKSKALNRAMEQLVVPYEIAVILDADNLMAHDFLQKVNAYFEKDVLAVQGHRTAKNQDTPLAILDAISEEINNHIFRKGHRAAGLSSAIIGSGMAFRYEFFRELMSDVSAVGGFDKDIELRMLKQKIRIGYLDDAYVYDEKVSRAEVFARQRRRWLSAQLYYFRRDFPASVKAFITSGNADYFDKAIQFMLPPRILLLGAMILLGAGFTIMNFFTGNNSVWNLLWAVTGFLYLATFVFSVPRKFYHLGTLKAIAGIPHGMLLMMVSLLRIKGANREFLHTEHTSAKLK